MWHGIIAVGVGLVLYGVTMQAMAAETGHVDGPGESFHRTVSGTVTDERSGLLSVKMADGTILQLAHGAARRHGHAPPKVGDEVTVVLNENNTIIDVHPQGEESRHQFVSGKLLYVGKMKPEIKLRTPEGEKTYPLGRQEVKTGGIEEGALVIAELNEAGVVIDLHRAK